MHVKVGGKKKGARGRGQVLGVKKMETKRESGACLHRALKHGVFCLAFIQKEKEQSISRE